MSRNREEPAVIRHADTKLAWSGMKTPNYTWIPGRLDSPSLKIIVYHCVNFLWVASETCGPWFEALTWNGPVLAQKREIEHKFVSSGPILAHPGLRKSSITPSTLCESPARQVCRRSTRRWPHLVQKHKIEHMFVNSWASWTYLWFKEYEIHLLKVL